MGRLIDEAEVIDMIQGSEELLDFQKDECIKCIEACDTAYDLGKVVESLKRDSYKEAADDMNPFEPPQVVNLSNAIEIVKGGGVDEM